MSDQLTMPDVDGLTDMLATIVSGFAFPEAGHASTGTEAFGARLSIDGDASVELYLEADPVAAPALAMAFFATGEPTAEDTRDAICELANIVAGGVKTLLGGDDEWSIGLPRPEMPESFDGWLVTQTPAGGGRIHLAFLPA